MPSLPSNSYSCYLVQVRIMLEDTYAALVDAAGNGHSSPPASETGVYMGCINYEYTEVLERGGAKARSHTSFQARVYQRIHAQSNSMLLCT